MRTLAREIVFKYVYSRLFNPNDEGLFDVLAKELNDDDKTFALTIKNQIISNEQIYFEKISDLSIGFKLNRIYSTDKCAMQIAICEMRYFDDVPNIVAISEAMELVRKYSTAESPNFVNGILAEFKKRLEE